MELKTRKLINSGAIKLELENLSKYDTGKSVWGESLASDWTPKAYTDFQQIMKHQVTPLPYPGGGVSVASEGIADINRRLAELLLPIKMKEIAVPQPDYKPKPQAEATLGSLAGNIIGSAINMIGTTDKAFRYDKDVNQLIVDAGQVSLNVGGIAYRANREIDARREMEEVKKQNFQNTLGTAASGAALGAGIGSVIPGIGTAIGAVGGALVGGITGLFGSASRKREARRKLEEALKKATAQNNWSSDLALSQAMKQEEVRAKNGKQPVYSAYGPVNAKADSWVSKGEVAIDTRTGNRYRIPTGVNDTAKFAGGKDPYTAIITNKYGLSDLAMQDPEAAIALQGMYKKEGLLNKSKGEAKNGKMPRRKEGWLPNAIISGIGGLMGLDQYLSARNQSIYRPNTYAPNTYEGRALPGLASLRYNQYPILNQINNQRAAYDYALNNSGGLSGAQKYLGKIANANNMYRTSADLLTNLQERNIGLKQNYYNTMLNVGAQDAQRRMAANQYDLDYYSKAHAARQQGMQMGMYNMLNQLQQYYANDFKRRQFNDTLSLYREDLDLKKSELASMNKSLQAQIDALKKLNKGNG